MTLKLGALIKVSMYDELSQRSGGLLAYEGRSESILSMVDLVVALDRHDL